MSFFNWAGLTLTVFFGCEGDVCVHSRCPDQRGSHPPRRSWGWCNLYTPSTACVQRPPPSPAGWDRTRSCSQSRAEQLCGWDQIKNILPSADGGWAAAAHPSLAPSRCMPVHPVTESVSIVGNSSYWGPRASCWSRQRRTFYSKLLTLRALSWFYRQKSRCSTTGMGGSERKKSCLICRHAVWPVLKVSY